MGPVRGKEAELCSDRALCLCAALTVDSVSLFPSNLSSLPVASANNSKLLVAQVKNLDVCFGALPLTSYVTSVRKSPWRNLYERSRISLLIIFTSQVRFNNFQLVSLLPPLSPRILASAARAMSLNGNQTMLLTQREVPNLSRCPRPPRLSPPLHLSSNSPRTGRPAFPRLCLRLSSNSLRFCSLGSSRSGLCWVP